MPQSSANLRCEMSLKITIKRRTIFAISILVITLIYLIVNNIEDGHNISVKRNLKQKFDKNEYCDWYDKNSIEKDKERTGYGEHGTKVVLTDETEIKQNEQLFQKTGFSVIVSEKISLNRSLPQLVHPNCSKIKYYAKLPKTSVIIIFHNEVKSVLLRTVWSVINRTPNELLHEVILVNDNSTNEELYQPLQDYVKQNFQGKVKIKNLSKRSGLIVTRMEGARMSSGEVLVFFDSHVEVQTNWLPPLLQPIVDNRRISTLPIVDYIDPFDFSFSEDQKNFQGKI